MVVVVVVVVVGSSGGTEPRNHENNENGTEPRDRATEPREHTRKERNTIATATMATLLQQRQWQQWQQWLGLHYCNSDNGNTVATATMATLFTKHLRGAKVLHGGTLRNWFCIKNNRNFNNFAWLSFSTSLFLAFGHNFRVLVINACHQRMSSTQSPNSLRNIDISKDS